MTINRTSFKIFGNRYINLCYFIHTLRNMLKNNRISFTLVKQANYLMLNLFLEFLFIHYSLEIYSPFITKCKYNHCTYSILK